MEPQVRRVARVIEPQPVVEGAGVRLRRSIAGWALDYLDPFLLFDHFESDDPDDYLAGFPLHPHRGIETVTYMLAGEVDHKDTIGNAGTIGPGDVQWMTAGGGIMHEEMPRPREGKMGGFQLWVNMPAVLKMSRPRYQEVAAATIPVTRTNGDAHVRGNALAGFAHLARRFHDLSYIAIALVQAREQDPDTFVKEQATAALAELKRSLRSPR